MIIYNTILANSSEMVRTMIAKAKTVKEIFEDMDYGNIKESCDLAEKWIEKHGLKIPKTADEIEKTIQNSEKQSESWSKVNASEKAKLLNKLAAEIKQHSNLICQIELHVRQVLTKDTINKSINLMTDYLRYYAGWTYLIEKHLPDYKPYGLCAAYLSETTPLGILGGILAPALAAGNTIILGVSSTLVPISCLISKLCENIGFPKGIISVIDVPNIEIFMRHKLIKKLTFIGNLHDQLINDIKTYEETYLTALHLGKSSAVVFDSADIDSACDSIVESAWSYRGMFPCGINKLYVQESIFKEFVKRFKTKIMKLNVGYPEDSAEKTIDVIIKNETFCENIKVDFINNIPLQIGHKTVGSSILLDEQNSGILSILAFRTANEAIALSNNTRFGLSTSVWTENINLANEISSKLKSSIVWINTHGYINANTAFSPMKGNGQGYFGGKEGLLEYMRYSKRILHTLKLETFSEGSECSNRKDIRNCVENATKGYETWSKIQSNIRSQYLLKLADLSESLKIKNTALLAKWIEYLREFAVLYDSTDSKFQTGKPDLKIAKESLGIIAIDLLLDDNYIYLKLVICALITGNSVILLDKFDMKEFLLELCKIIPVSGITSGAFNVILHPNAEVAKILLSHREIQAYFYSVTKEITFKHMQIIKHFQNVNFNSFDILKVFATNKCIWTSVGESFL